MPRRPRSSLPDGFFHVTTRAAGAAAIFDDPIDRNVFLQILWRAIEHHEWVCHAFCLMGTHYHLVLQTTVDQLSAGMHELNGTYAQRFNERHHRRGHVFGARFSSWVIEDEEHFQAALAYVLGNPVRAGLVHSPDQWRWSGLGAPQRGADPGQSLGHGVSGQGEPAGDDGGRTASD